MYYFEVVVNNFRAVVDNFKAFASKSFHNPLMMAAELSHCILGHREIWRLAEAKWEFTSCYILKKS